MGAPMGVPMGVPMGSMHSHTFPGGFMGGPFSGPAGTDTDAFGKTIYKFIERSGDVPNQAVPPGQPHSVPGFSAMSGPFAPPIHASTFPLGGPVGAPASWWPYPHEHCPPQRSSTWPAPPPRCANSSSRPNEQGVTLCVFDQNVVEKYRNQIHQNIVTINGDGSTKYHAHPDMTVEALIHRLGCVTRANQYSPHEIKFDGVGIQELLNVGGGGRFMLGTTVMLTDPKAKLKVTELFADVVKDGENSAPRYIVRWPF